MQGYTCEIISIKAETHAVRTFRLRRPKNLGFISGQYCMVSFPDRFEEESRPFTFSSSPAEKDYFEMTIKKMHEFTSAMFELRAGDQLVINGPFGEELNFDESIDDDIVFIAGGSGITPFMSAIRYHTTKNMRNKIMLLYANRTEEDIIYLDELDGLVNDKIDVIHFLSKQDDLPDGFESGRIDQIRIKKYISEITDKLWYVCGPPPMTASMKKMLLELGITQERIRIEKWELPGRQD